MQSSGTNLESSWTILIPALCEMVVAFVLCMSRSLVEWRGRGFALRVLFNPLSQVWMTIHQRENKKVSHSGALTSLWESGAKAPLPLPTQPAPCSERTRYRLQQRRLHRRLIAKAPRETSPSRSFDAPRGEWAQRRRSPFPHSVLHAFTTRDAVCINDANVLDYTPPL